MADNYLENKMEEHRNNPARRMRGITPAGRKPGYALLPFDVKTAIVKAPAVSLAAREIISELRATGCRVALISSDPEAAKAAQQLSCIHIPSSDSATTKADELLGNSELRIKVEPQNISVELDRGSSTIRKADVTDEKTFAHRSALLCVYLALPDSAGRVYGDFVI